jgi:imidazolonepropionase-like amidohydrolase
LGGVLSRDDDPHFQQSSGEELKTKVEEAGRMKRVVAAHVHGKEGIMAALRAGCATLEHGTYMDDEAMQLMKEKGTVLVATRTVVEAGMENLDLLSPEKRAKMIETDEVDRAMYKRAVTAGLMIALGTDLASSIPGTPFAHGNNGKELGFAVKAGMTPLEAIEARTANGPATLGPQAPPSG